MLICRVTKNLPVLKLLNHFIKSSAVADKRVAYKKNLVYCKKELKIVKDLHHKEKLCMYKMVDISAKTWNKAEVSIIKIHENDNVNKTLYNLIDKEIKVTNMVIL